MTNERDTYCDMRGMLSFLILFLLSKKRMNGQEITEELEKRKGCKPSPGTVYPALKKLHEAELIKEEKDQNKIFYKLTQKGEHELKISKIQFCKIFSDIF